MKTRLTPSTQGSTLVVTISVVAGLMVLLAVAVDYTTQISRNTQRSRKTALAMEIADGHLEALFTSWRNIYRNTWTTSSNNSGGTDYAILGTNFFFTSSYNPGPAPTAIPLMTPAATPPTIPAPDPSLFPNETNFQLTQYRIQAVDPMISLDTDGNALRETTWGSQSFVALSPAATPPAAYGKNKWQYSYFYLASVDVSVPTTTGNVTAKVRRVFEKKFDNPWTYAMFFVDDLELHPTDPLAVTGPIHTNGSLYIGTSNFTTTSLVEFAGEYVNGYSPADTWHTAAVTKPNFAKSDPSLSLSDMPPAQVSPYLPFGWTLKLASGGAQNDDSYHELIEQAVSTDDPLKEIRLYNQACYRILIASNNNIKVYKKDGTALGTDLPLNNGAGKELFEAITTNVGMKDPRENKFVRLADVDINKITLAAEAGKLPNWNGIIYIADTTNHGTNQSSQLGTSGASITTTMRAIRLVNGHRLPRAEGDTNTWDGLTIVSVNPVYIKGNYNTAYNSGDSVPSNSGTYTDPDSNVNTSNNPSQYVRKLAAVIGDSVTVLSAGWSDTNSIQSHCNDRPASANITINAALVAGNVASAAGYYSGGGENFVRILEDWKTKTMCVYGSLVQLYRSVQANTPWDAAGNLSKPPQTQKFYWDPNYGDNALTTYQAGPPGNLQIAAYLQQQRWYQVY